MAYVFQQSSTDNISFTLPVSMWGSDSIGLITGWYWLTAAALNATFWHAGTDANAARIMSVTTNLRVYSDTNATNGYADFGSSISTGKWMFLAVCMRISGSLLGNGVLWLGDVNTPPQDVGGGVANTGSGTAVTGTNARIGSDVSLGYSFDGYAADVSVFVSKTNSNANFFGHSPATAFNTATETRILNEFVMPIWRGDYASAFHPDKRRTAVVGTAEQDGFLVHMPLRNNTQSVGRLGTTPNGQGTNTGATVATLQTSPRNSPMDLYPPHTTRITGRRMR